MALYFFGLEVRNRRAVLNAPFACDRARDVEQGLGERRLAGAAVTDEHDVSDFLWRCSGQRPHPLLKSPLGSRIVGGALEGGESGPR